MTSGGVIAIIVITVALSAAFVPFVRGATTSSGVPATQVAAIAWFDNSTGLNLLAYSFNQFGQPVAGTLVNVTVDYGTRASRAGGTNGSGYFQAVVPMSYTQGTVLVTLSQSTMGQGMPPPDGEVIPFMGNIAPVLDSTDPNKVDIAVFFAATGGTPPSGFPVYVSLSAGGPVVAVDGNMTVMGHLASYHTVLTLPASLNITQDSTVSFNIANTAGAVVYSAGFPGSMLESQSQVLSEAAPRIQAFATSFVGGLLGLFVPLMAILAAYSTYGKDRVSGVLESVLARPVTRRGLATSRYSSTVLAMALAVVLNVLALDLVVWYFIGVALSAGFLAVTSAALIVEAAAFVGIVFALSRVAHSTGTLIGVGVGLWAILDFFWSLIPFLITSALGYQFGSAGYYRVLVDSNFFNPAQYFGLVGTYMTNSLVGGLLSIGGFQLNPGDYGITPATLVLSGALWIMVPLGLFLYLAINRD